jgi:hypothetical protein
MLTFIKRLGLRNLIKLFNNIVKDYQKDISVQILKVGGLIIKINH